MRSHHSLAWVLALLLPAAPCAAAPVPPRPEAAGDALPKGALLRLGTLRLHHGGLAINVVFAPDSKSLASCGNDSLVRLWDAATGKEIRHFKGHTGNVDGLAISPNGKTILSSASDGTGRLWDVATGKELLVLNGHRGMVNAACFAPDGKTVATKGADGTGRIWDAASGKELHVFPVARDQGSPLAFSPDGKTVAVVHTDLTLHLLDTATAKDVQTFAGHGANLNSLDFSPDGKVLASAGGDGLARLWDVATGKELHKLQGHDGVVSSVHISPDGKLVATGGADKTVRFWDAATGKELRRGTGHTLMVSEVGFSPDGKMLASASWDNTVRLWDVATARELPQSAGPGPVACAALSADGKVLVTGHAGDGVHLSDPATGKPLRPALELSGAVTALVVSRDGQLIAAGNAAGDVAVWEGAGARKRFAVEAPKQKGFPRRRTLVIALAPDGQMLAVSGNEPGSGIEFFDATGKRVRSSGPVAAPGDGTVHFPPHALLFTPDGHIYLTASTTEGVKLFETMASKEVRQLLAPSQERTVAAIALAPDGRAAAAVGSDGTLWVWETGTGGERRHWQADKVGGTAVAFSADGRLLATADVEGAVRVWHVAGGKELRSFAGHEGRVTELAFAPGRLLSVGADGTALLWDTSNLKPEAKAAADKIEPAAAWAALGADSTAKAYEMMIRLEESPEAAVALLRERLKATTIPDAKRIDQLIAQLDDDDFKVRENASQELANLGPLAEKALRKAAKATPSAEATRSVSELLKKIDEGAVSGEGVRQSRAMEVLEGIGTPAAKKVLEELAKGAPDAALTREAKASLERLAKRGGAPR